MGSCELRGVYSSGAILRIGPSGEVRDCMPEQALVMRDVLPACGRGGPAGGEDAPAESA